ncbi:NUDIX domain-containing protein [Candidatus Saccharibacteria bacterium]|nr:NUDIX domain-containing protein [Candidatus Saccharibacteria bacterium]
MSEVLDIVNDQDEVIGQAERDEVHRIGLVCRLAYVCFYTANREIILQKRSMIKKNDPGKLTTTVSGHVASGQDYLEAAVREALEETGVEIKANDLTAMGVVRADYVQGDYLSNAMRGLFSYQFDGNISDLKVEDGDGAGFVTLPIEEFEKQLDTEPEKFATVLTDKVGRDLVQKIKNQLDA